MTEKFKRGQMVQYQPSAAIPMFRGAVGWYCQTRNGSAAQVDWWKKENYDFVGMHTPLCIPTGMEVRPEDLVPFLLTPDNRPYQKYPVGGSVRVKTPGHQQYGSPGVIRSYSPLTLEYEVRIYGLMYSFKEEDLRQGGGADPAATARFADTAHNTHTVTTGSTTNHTEENAMSETAMSETAERAFTVNRENFIKKLQARLNDFDTAAKPQLDKLNEQLKVAKNYAARVSEYLTDIAAKIQSGELVVIGSGRYNNEIYLNEIYLKVDWADKNRTDEIPQQPAKETEERVQELIAQVERSIQKHTRHTRRLLELLSLGTEKTIEITMTEYAAALPDVPKKF